MRRNMNRGCERVSNAVVGLFRSASGRTEADAVISTVTGKSY